MEKITFFIKIAALRLSGVIVCGCLLAISFVLWLALYIPASLNKYYARVYHRKKIRNQRVDESKAGIAYMFDFFKA